MNSQHKATCRLVIDVDRLQQLIACHDRYGPDSARRFFYLDTRFGKSDGIDAVPELFVLSRTRFATELNELCDSPSVR